jgi:toxin ParE1/3/4
VTPWTIHVRARGEVREAVEYYDAQRDGLGDEFLAEFEAAVESIRRMPEAYPPVGQRGMRKHHLKRFPYTIYYAPSPDGVWIAAVAHQKRRPGYWASRRPGQDLGEPGRLAPTLRHATPHAPRAGAAQSSSGSVKYRTASSPATRRSGGLAFRPQSSS